MKNMYQWFNEYAVSHQHKTNQLIHFFCVPIIFFSIIGMLMSIPSQPLQKLLNSNNDLLINFSTPFIIAVLIFYVLLSIRTSLIMLIFSLVSLIGNYYISKISPLFQTSLVLFVAAWIGQFYGHKIEGKKPSFLKDIQFLLIGPAWVFHKISRKLIV